MGIMQTGRKQDPSGKCAATRVCHGVDLSSVVDIIRPFVEMGPKSKERDRESREERKPLSCVILVGSFFLLVAVNRKVMIEKTVIRE